MTAVTVERASLLIEQGRFQEAQKCLGDALADDPENAIALSLLAHCLVGTKRHKEAAIVAGNAIALEPEYPFAHSVMARALEGQGKMSQAMDSIKCAIRLDPYEEEFHAILATFHIAQKQWDKALSAAQDGLAIDPESVTCANMRALALVQLGRVDDASHTLDTAMRRDPENAMSHANKGWAELNRGNYKKSFDYFREALRLEPDMEFAREGVLHAMRATSPLYRPILKFYLFQERLTSRQQWFLAIGLVVGLRILRSFGRQNPEIAPFVSILAYAYIAFVYLTWTAPILHNVFLRFHRFGKLALNRSERLGATLAGLSFGSGVAALISCWQLDSGRLLLGGVMLIAFVLPLGGSFAAAPGPKRKFLMAYTAIMLVVGVMSAVAQVNSIPLFGLFMLMTFAFTWIAAVLR